MKSPLLVLCFLLLGANLATRAGDFSSADWARMVEHAPFSARDTAEGVSFHGKLWLSNGYLTGNQLVRDLWSSTDATHWTQISTNTPYDGYAEMIVYDGKLWAIKQSVWSSADGEKWQQVSEKTPFGVRGYGELVVHQDKMWQLGSGADAWNTTSGVAWHCATSNAPYGPRFASAVTAFRDQLWVMGGAIEKTNTPPEKLYKQFTTYNDVWRSADGVSWMRVTEHAPWSARMWFVPIVFAERLWIIGGFDNVNRCNLGDVWWTDDGEKWHQLETKTKFSPRHEVTAYVHDNSLWVVAGNSWPLINDVWKLTEQTGDSTRGPKK